MTTKLWIVAALTVVGFFVGSGIGIAFGGGMAINGSFLVAGVSGFIAYLIVPSEQRPDSDTLEETSAAPETTDELARSGLELLKQVVGWVGSALRALWNLEMALLATIGVIHFFQKLPILFFVLALGLLLVFLPVGVLFVATGIAALLRNPKSEGQFKVALA